MPEIMQEGAIAPTIYTEQVNRTVLDRALDRFGDFIQQHKRLSAGLTAGTLALGLSGCGGDNLESVNPTTPSGAPAPTEAPVPTTTAEAVVCGDTWVIEQADNTDHRWLANGVDAIDKADTDPKAQKAFEAWLHEVKKDPDLLAGAAAAIIDKEVNAEDLADSRCASDLAEQITAEIEIAVAMGEVKPSEAPTSGRNTGIDSAGNVVTAEGSGISGDRKAILIITKNGKKVWVLRRCGNPVTEGIPNLPEGPTDENPTAPIKHPRPQSGPHTQPGDGGDQGSPAEPGCDSSVTGYCEGQQPDPPTTTAEASTTTHTVVVPTTGDHTATTQEPIPAPTSVDTTAPDGPPPTNVP